MTVRSFFLGGIFMVSFAAAQAAEAPATKDYSQALGRLMELGIPDTKGAVPVTSREAYGALSASLWKDGQKTPDPEVARSLARIRRQGEYNIINAVSWFFPGEGASPPRFGFGVAPPVSAGGPIRLAQEGEKSSNFRRTSGKRAAAPQEFVLAKADLAQVMPEILKQLEPPKPTGKKDEDMEIEYRNRQFARLLPPCLILAAQFREAGLTEEANKLAAAVFAASDKPAAVLDGVVSLMANNGYAEACADLFTDKPDWEAFTKKLGTLLEKYPRGWNKAPAIRKLQGLLAKRAATLPELKAPAGVTLDPEAVKALTEAVMGGSPLKIPGYGGKWLLSGGRALQASGEGYEEPEDGDATRKPEKPDPFRILAERRLAALPVWVAALSLENVFLPATLTRDSNSDFMIISGMDREKSEEEKLEEMWGEMERPTSLAEVARNWILAALPQENYELREMEAGALGDMVMEWWKQHRDDDTGKLAVHFLEDGESQAQRAALAWLTESDKPEHQALVEKYLLGGNSSLEHFSEIESYLESRGPKAAEFLARFKTKVLEEFKDWKPAAKGEERENDDASQALQRFGGPQKMLDQLSAHVVPVADDTLLAEAASADLKLSALTRKFQARFVLDKPGAAPGAAPADPFRAFNLALRCVGVIQKKKDKLRFLGFMAGLAGDLPKEETKPAEGGKPEGKQIAGYKPNDEDKAHWRKLVEDKTSVSPMEIGMDVPTVGHLAALVLEMAFDEEGYETMQTLVQGLSMSGWTIYHERALARLDGKDLPPMPSADNVPAARVEEIKKQGFAASAEQLPAFVNGLTNDEKLVWVAALGEEEKQPAGVAGRNGIVAELRGQTEGPAKALAETLNGRKIEVASVKALFAALPALAGADKVSLAIFGPHPQGLGLVAILDVLDGADELGDVMSGADLGKLPEDSTALLVLLGLDKEDRSPVAFTMKGAELKPFEAMQPPEEAPAEAKKPTDAQKPIEERVAARLQEPSASMLILLAPKAKLLKLKEAAENSDDDE